MPLNRHNQVFKGKMDCTLRVYDKYILHSYNKCGLLRSPIHNNINFVYILYIQNTLKLSCARHKGQTILFPLSVLINICFL